VFIGEPQTDEFLHLRAGKVLFHSPDREAVYQKAIPKAAGGSARAAPTGTGRGVA